MNFKMLVEADAQALMNNNEFAEEVIYRNNIILGILDELETDIVSGAIFRLSVAFTDVPMLAREEFFIVRGVSYRVVDFNSFSGVTEIILNKA